MISNEHIALLSICLNNAGVRAFERGNIDLALKFMFGALHPVKAMSKSLDKNSRITKKQALKTIKSQRKSFDMDQTLEICESKHFGARRRSRTHSTVKQVSIPTEQSSTYTYRKLLTVKASTSTPLLHQISQDELTAIFLANLGVCHHHIPASISEALFYYRAAAEAASMCGNLFIRLVAWNNLLQIYSDDLLDENSARACLVELGGTITQLNASGWVSKVKWHGRKGFILNVIVFSNPITLAPAA